MNNINSRAQNFIKTAFSISAAVSVILSLILLIKSVNYWGTFTLILLFTVAGLLIMRLLCSKGKSINWFLTIAILNFLFIVPELFLRVIDFRYESGVQYNRSLEYGGLRPEHCTHFVPDQNLFWKLPSSMDRVNSLGFPGEEIIMPKPPSEFRIIYLGDSVTELGFGVFVARYLNDNYAGDSVIFNSVTLAVCGYSSYQGVVLAEKYALKYDPDLVVVFFGWNDHWLAYKARDSEMELTSGQNLYMRLNHQLRTLQLLSKLLVGGDTAKSSGLLNTVRVLPDEYHHNLDKIDSIFESVKVPVLFITAPTSHYKLGVPDYLIAENYAVSADSAVSMHKSYNQIVRDIASEKNAYLLDLERDYDTLSNLNEIFIGDGIHFTPYGTQFTARRIFEFVINTIF